MARRERAIEIRVVSDNLRVASKFHQAGERLIGRGSICNVLVVDIRQVRHVIGNRLARVDERHVPIDDLPMLHSRRCDLRQLVMIE